MFGDKREKEEKKAEDKQKFIERYQLEELDEDDIKELYEIYRTSDFSFVSGHMQQNFIIIKILNKINNNLEELKNK